VLHHILKEYSGALYIVKKTDKKTSEAQIYPPFKIYLKWAQCALPTLKNLPSREREAFEIRA